MSGYSSTVEQSDPRDLPALVELVQRIVAESGDPVGFDAVAWTKRWIRRPAPALGGARPMDYMETPEGTALVEALVRRMQSGAYS